MSVRFVCAGRRPVGCGLTSCPFQRRTPQSCVVQRLAGASDFVRVVSTVCVRRISSGSLRGKLGLPLQPGNESDSPRPNKTLQMTASYLSSAPPRDGDRRGGNRRLSARTPRDEPRTLQTGQRAR